MRSFCRKPHAHGIPRFRGYLSFLGGKCRFHVYGRDRFCCISGKGGKMRRVPDRGRYLARGIPTLLDPLQGQECYEPGPRHPFELGYPPALPAGTSPAMSVFWKGKGVPSRGGVPAWGFLRLWGFGRNAGNRKQAHSKQIVFDKRLASVWRKLWRASQSDCEDENDTYECLASGWRTCGERLSKTTCNETTCLGFSRAMLM